MGSLFGFISNPLEIGLVALSILVTSAGLGIILFTVAIRVVLSPLQIAQLRNAKSMQKLQPLVAELKKKHGKDRQAMAEKTRELYKEHQVNPAIGCMLTLVQFPILIGLFYALRALAASPTGWPAHPKYGMTCGGKLIHAFPQWVDKCYTVSHITGSPSQIFDLFHAQFLWLSNGLGEKDPLFILPILAGVTQWVQSRMMLTKSNDPQQQMMNTLMNFMPLMIIFFANIYPAGLALYWVTSTLIAILIQYRITGWGLLPETLNKILGAGIAPRGTAGSRPPPRGGGSSPRNETARKLKNVTREDIAPNGNDAGGDDTVPNGKAADGAVAARSPATARSRKQANRARGGRKSGRRG